MKLFSVLHTNAMAREHIHTHQTHTCSNSISLNKKKSQSLTTTQMTEMHKMVIVYFMYIGPKLETTQTFDKIGHLENEKNIFNNMD